MASHSVSVLAREMADVDVWLVAALLIQRFADEAHAIAAECAGVLKDIGDEELSTLWKRVSESIAEFERTGRGSNGSVH